ncbi:Spindle pole body component alp4 [Psilocybe cubensis]|uniref:Spindle pole body component n=2 Tax=Psilocybe cubensis TaxID=181762 RepID=A0A8H8CIZ7_PSICU|nr:Spindle pole body component alp4 [Psilocybe cubensis]KAH9475975.1 Spindle pole body component alp4 [Psilocybe cubensis]
MDSYTPRTLGHPGGRKKTIGLSKKEYTKITGTIASVRRNRHDDAGALSDHDDYNDLDSNQGAGGNLERATGSAAKSSTRRSHTHGYAKQTRPSLQPDSSFIAETSFVRAPLNSRVVSSSSAVFPNHTEDSSANGGTYGSARTGSAKGKGKQHNGKMVSREPLDRFPLDIQEAMILEDLLFVLMGIEGTYITYHSEYSPEDDDPLLGIRFVVAPTLDSSLGDLVERIIPLGMYYTAIHAFIEQRSHLDFGLVNHALCAAIREMLRDYQTLLSQLEHAFNTSPSFSLQKLWFYVHPTVHTLSLIYQLILELATADGSEDNTSESSSTSEDEEEAARNEALGLGGAKLKAVLSEINQGGADVSSSGIAVKGGEVLAIIYERMQNMSGDPTACEIYGKLLREAEKPYVEMIRDWVSCGRLVDKYEEMMVKESKFIDRGILDVDYTDEYWERRYTLRDGSISPGSSKRHQAGIPMPRSVGGRMPGGACVPPLLESWKHKVLLAGKYLNVIRECGIELQIDKRYSNHVSMDDEKFYTFIQEAYSNANRTLLQLLIKDQQLIPRLRSFKRFFFLSQSSFLTHFLDLAATELRKPSKAVSTVKLQSLLELSLNTDDALLGDDALFRDDLRVVMADSGLYDFLLKVVTVTGVIKTEDAEEKEPVKEKEDKKAMQVIEALAFDYSVKFPLSLVISRKTILRYQLLFRFLLHLKHVEQALSAMWIEQKSYPWRTSLARFSFMSNVSSPSQTSLGVGTSSRTYSNPSSSSPSNNNAHGNPRSATPSGTPTTFSGPTSATTPAPTVQQSFPSEFHEWRLRVCILRARMLAVIQQILAFITFEVLDPNWRALERKLEHVETVDQLLRDHVDFLDTCLKESMLTSSKLLKACNKLIVVCQTFALYSASFTKSVNQALAAAMAYAESGINSEDVFVDPTRAKRWEVLTKFEMNFNHWFQVHLDCVQFYASSDNVSLLPLVVRLNSVKSA